MKNYKRIFFLMQEFSLFLLAGVALALVFANLEETIFGYEGAYQQFLNKSLAGDFKIFGHPLTFSFIVNEFFMAFFFGLAAVEITSSLSRGGELNPLSKAINPLFGTVGGVIGPVAFFFLLAHLLPFDNLFASGVTQQELLNGWGIPTATDIALAWLLATQIFGKNHPAVAYLLLLAIVDDAIGLVIIAVFYPSPDYPVAPEYLLLVCFAMLVSYLLKRNKVRHMVWYLLLGGIPAWVGLLLSHLHPALALVVVVPFMPLAFPKSKSQAGAKPHSTLFQFERVFKVPVDLGLFAFGLANAGVSLGKINAVTWLILGALVLGKLFGIFFFSLLGKKCGFPLPDQVGLKELTLLSLVAGLGLTVALFISGQAYAGNPLLQEPAKMGALLSIGVIFISVPLAWLLRIKRINR